MSNQTFPEKLVRLKAAASYFGVSYRQMLDALNAGLIPYYIIQNTKYVRLSEIEAVLQQQRQGGE